MVVCTVSILQTVSATLSFSEFFSRVSKRLKRRFASRWSFMRKATASGLFPAAEGVRLADAFLTGELRAGRLTAAFFAGVRFVTMTNP
jgi:hypothetical protein